MKFGKIYKNCNTLIFIEGSKISQDGVLLIFYVLMLSNLCCLYQITKASFVVDVLLNSSCRSFADVFVFLCVLPA